MLNQPSYRLVSLEELLVAARGYDDAQKDLWRSRSNMRNAGEFARLLARDESTRASVALMDATADSAQDSIRSWIRGGCGKISSRHAIVENAGDVPLFVLRVWACWRYVERKHPRKAELWLESLPEEVSSLVRDIKINLK